MEIKSNIQAEGEMSIMGQIISSVISAAPFVVASTLLVTGLNSDLLDGQHGSYYQNRANHTGSQTISTVTGLQSAIDLKANASDLSGYVSRTVPGTISADHNFTGGHLTLPATPYHNLLSNVAYVNYYPVGGNGAAHSFVNFRVYDASTGGNRVLALGGDDTFTWNGANIALQSWVTSRNYITANSADTLINKTGLISQWTNNAGYLITSDVTGMLGDYVSRTNPAIITAGHNFTGTDLTLPSIHYHNMLSNNAYVNYYPLGGNGAVNTSANIRVWNGATGTQRTFFIGGDGTLAWNGIAIPTLTDVMSNIATDTNLLLAPFHYHNLLSNVAYVNYYPVGGNGANHSFAYFRVYDATTGGNKTMVLGGDNTFTWNGANIALQSWVTSQSYASESYVNSRGFITSVVGSLGYVPYNSSNPAGYTSNSGTVTQVGLTVPSGFYVTSSPVTGAGNLSFEFAAGYSLPTNSKQSEWDAKLGGSGSSGYFPKWTGSNSFGNSSVYDNGSEILFNNTRSYGYEGNTAFRAPVHAHDYLAIGKLGQHGRIMVHDSSSFTEYSSSAISVQSTSRGFHHSGMTLAQRNAMSGVVDGVFIYQTDNTPGFYGRVSGAWIRL